MKKILIIGSTSAIAQSTARIYAQMGYELFLTARNQKKLSLISNELKTLGAYEVHKIFLDVNQTSEHEKLINTVFDTLGSIDVALICHGTLPSQKECEANAKLTEKELNTNAISTILLLTYLANKFVKQERGTLAIITSVAGDRGRLSNYVYGSAKGMVNIFLQGLRARLDKKGVNVLTIKPGMVDTPMTASLKKGFLWTSPDKVAIKITKAINKKKSLLYVPWYWCLIMFGINLIPEFLFKKIKL